MRHELHFCQQRIGCTGGGIQEASFKTCNRTLWVNFAGDAPPSIARQPQSLLYLLLLLAWLFHSRQRILHDEDASKVSGGCELALISNCKARLLGCRGVSFRKCFGWGLKSVPRQSAVAVGQPGIGSGIGWIIVDRLLKILLRLLHAFAGSLIPSSSDPSSMPRMPLD